MRVFYDAYIPPYVYIGGIVGIIAVVLVCVVLAFIIIRWIRNRRHK